MSGPASKLKKILRASLKIFALSLLISVIAACIGAVYSLVVYSRVLAPYLITANFIVGALVVAAALAIRAFPVNLKREGPVDHTNYADIVMKTREKRRGLSSEILYVGFGVYLIAGAVEILIM